MDRIKNIYLFFHLKEKNKTRKTGGVSKSMLTLNEAIIDIKEG